MNETNLGVSNKSEPGKKTEEVITLRGVMFLNTISGNNESSPGSSHILLSAQQFMHK